MFFDSDIILDLLDKKKINLNNSFTANTQRRNVLNI